MDLIGDVRFPLKAAWPASRFQPPSTMRLSCGCVLFGLLTALGLLAFFFPLSHRMMTMFSRSLFKAKSRSTVSSSTAKPPVQFIRSVRTKSGPRFSRNGS